jgi:hypothetical protein
MSELSKELRHFRSTIVNGEKSMRNRNRWWMVDNVKTNPSLKVMYHIRHDVQISHDRNEKI